MHAMGLIVQRLARALFCVVEGSWKDSGKIRPEDANRLSLDTPE